MNNQLFAATTRTSEIVGREPEMNQIKTAICRPASDRSTQIVFIQGMGGFGKTRLLEETLWRLGHSAERNSQHLMTDEQRARGWDWSKETNAIVLGLIDLIDIGLHSSNNFVFELYKRFTQANIVFPNYLGKRQRYQQLLQQGVDFVTAQHAADEALGAFFEDYNQFADRRRVVWLIDTAEQLSDVSSQWLRTHLDADGRPLLRDNDLHFQTQQWLADQIQAGRLQNTTILLAGRDKEGADFFKSISEAAAVAKCQPMIVSSRPFEVHDVQQYFELLAQDWERRESGPLVDQKGEQTLATQDITRLMLELATNLDRAKVLWLYTGGQPVLLSLFADLINEGSPMPEPLQDNFDEAIQRAQTDSPNRPTPQLYWARWQAEDEFISLLFSRPYGRPTLYRDILEVLVRTPRGLTPEQIHFVLDSPSGVDLLTWIPDRRRLLEIEDAIGKGIQRSALVKTRPNGVGLQDEIYRIYAEHMAPHIYASPEVQELWDIMMSPEEQTRYRENHEHEQKARVGLYTLLRDWANYRLSKLRDEEKRIRLEEERQLEAQLGVMSPTQPRALRFASLSTEERERRLHVHTQIIEQNLEYMHYSLLLDPPLNFNTVYGDLADEQWRANDEDRDVITQYEMLRVIHDPYVLKFSDMPTRPALDRRHEKALRVLHRAAEQEDVARWIKRFVLRKQYERAIQFTDAVEHAIRELPEATEQELNDKESWLHSLSWGERQCWREYACILASQNVQEAIGKLNEIGQLLTLLSRQSTEEVVLPDKGRWGENGFRGHPAETRLRRVTSLTYNFLGYGCATLRQFREALGHYGRALYFAHETGARAHKATVLNNMSRAQSEMGRYRAVRLCRDALSLRREMGADFPIALSLSTLALIYNDQNRPDEAWREAAKAMAYARRVEDSRVLGLALNQLGEALRRLAGQEIKLGRTLREPPEAVYEAAQGVLEEAHSLFFDPKSEASREPLRLIETKVELGCLHRDYLLTLIPRGDAEGQQVHLGSALALLREALRLADQQQFEQLKLDAAINIAWTYYYTSDHDNAEKMAVTAEDLISAWLKVEGGRLLEPDETPPLPIDHESVIYYQLSKLCHLRGRIGLDHFLQQTTELKRRIPGIDRASRWQRQDIIDSDSEAQKFLESAASNYVQGVAYAQLFSPRSSALSAIYDTLYEYLKRFNQRELRRFTEYLYQYRRSYRVNEIQPEDLGDLSEFMRECFGELTE